MSSAHSNSNFSVDSHATVSVDRGDVNFTQKLPTSFSTEASSHQDSRSNPVQHIPQHDWSDRAYKLRDKNREFCKKIEKLEQALAEAKEESHKLQKRAENAEILIARQAEEMGNSQKRFNQLLQELEVVRQESHNKQISIERLSAKLEVSQEQTARIERECTNLQEAYHEQQYKLLETEQQAKELNARLHRQQRHALQYKTALERQADNSSSSGEISRELDSTIFDVNKQPIQAWSIQNDRLNYITDLNLQTNAQLESQEKVDSTTEQPIEVDTEKSSFNSKDTNYLPVQQLPVEDSNTKSINKKQIAHSSSSPSPLIATSSGSKKPKSLAAIDLPTFPRYRVY
jgi:chromosome segregation ATPase